MRVLILGGTADARALAAALDEGQVRFISSLAGRVGDPKWPVGTWRFGGFGGVSGLMAFMAEVGITHVVNATHPFAAQMSANAVTACAEFGMPLVRLARPGWSQHPDAASWHWVDDLDGALSVAGELGERPFVTTGAQTLGAYETWVDRDVLVRVIEPPAGLPERWTVVRDRGPYTLDGELALLREHRIDVLTTKDSGGKHTSAKLDACRELGVPVVIVRRPMERATDVVSSVNGVLEWLDVG